MNRVTIAYGLFDESRVFTRKKIKDPRQLATFARDPSNCWRAALACHVAWPWQRDHGYSWGRTPIRLELTRMGEKK